MTLISAVKEEAAKEVVDRKKQPFLAAVQTNRQNHPLRIRLSAIESFTKKEIRAWVEKMFLKKHTFSLMVYIASELCLMRAINTFAKLSNLAKKASIIRVSNG